MAASGSQGARLDVAAIYEEKESAAAKAARQTEINRRGRVRRPGRVARNISATMYIRDRGGGRPCRRGSSCPPVVATRLAGAPYTRVRVLRLERSSSGDRHARARARARVYVCACVCARECVNTQGVRVSRPPDNSRVNELAGILNADSRPTRGSLETRLRRSAKRRARSFGESRRV